MSKAKLYYTAPSDECFEDMKKCAIQVWNEYDDEYGYATGKIARIKDIGNIEDNFMYILAMFDQDNQQKVGELLQEKTKEEARARMIDGGMEPWQIPF